MDRWQNGTEAYRAIQAMVREGRFHEAADATARLLAAGGLSRKQAARLHLQMCWLFTEFFPPGPEAALHGEQALVLADLMNESYLRAEALHRLVLAYCSLGDVGRACEAWEQLAAIVFESDTAIAGGEAALLALRAAVARAEGDEGARLSALERAEAAALRYPDAVGARIRLQRALALLEAGRVGDARPMLGGSQRPPAGVDHAEWALARAWLAAADVGAYGGPAPEAKLLQRAWTLAEGAVRAARAGANPGAEALALAVQARLTQVVGEDGGAAARLALERAVAAGRREVAAYLRRSLDHLLQSGA